MIKEVAKKLGLWKKIEIVGDIAIVGIPFDKKPQDMKELAEDILREIPYVKSIWGKYRDVSGDFRLATLEYIAGERKSETLYREHGCLYYLDITKVFFSSKLSFEHLRVANQVKPGEVIINMFAGFGPFSILSYVRGKARKVYSIDINPYAYHYMMANIDLNRAYGVIPMYGDAFKRIYDIDEKYIDRIIIPLPEKADEAYEVALQKSTKGKTIINLYTQIEVEKGEDPIKKSLQKYHPNAFFARILRSVNPHTYHIAVDIKVQ